MERLFKRQEVNVACGVTYTFKKRRKPLEARIEGLTNDLSIEGARIRLYETPPVKVGQMVCFDVGSENSARALVRGIEPAGGNAVIRLEFVQANQLFLAEIVPLVKSAGVSNASVSEWSAG